MLRQNYPQNIFSLTEVTGVSGSVIFTIIPCDWSVAVGKLTATTLSGTSPTLDMYLQTQDPTTGTFHDVAHFTQLGASLSDQNANFVSFGKPTGFIGTAPTLGLAAGAVSGLPLLSRTMKANWVYGGTVGTANVTLTLAAVDQDIPG
jgi:hypothetical protein